MVVAPEPGELWHYPPWSNPQWTGPWRVVCVREARPEEEFVGAAVYLERVDGPPESWSNLEYGVELARWPGKWERWPEVPDFPPV